MTTSEIGGYFGMETFSGAEYHTDCSRLNLGRTALIELLRRMKIRTLYVPHLLCDSVTQMCEAEGTALRFYRQNRQLEPVFDAPMADGEALLLVSYLGQLTDRKILRAKERFGTVIADHTHSFFQKPLPGIPTLYSCRKYFGLPDGAYVSAPFSLGEGLPADCSARRMAHILGRFEDGAAAHFSQMHETAAAFSFETPKQMSALTKNLLRGIDYAAVRKKREENYARLEALLGADNPVSPHFAGSAKIPLDPFAPPVGPLAYPFYCRRGIELRKRLAQQNIYVPTYWTNVIETMPKDSPEYHCAASVLPLPCDQRYDGADMRRVAAAVSETIQRLEEE